MPASTRSQIPDAEARAKATKRINAVTAILAGGLTASLLAYWFRTQPDDWLIGFLAGLVWANGFEFFYHRFLLHWPRSIFAGRHLRHHAETANGTSIEDVNFGSSPLAVILLFLVNGAPVLLLQLLSGFPIAPGMLTAFAVYVVTVEEIHWRIHMSEWLPPVLRLARAYHLAHHDSPESRFNVFLPIFDHLFGTAVNSWVLPHSVHGHLR